MTAPTDELTAVLARLRVLEDKDAITEHTPWYNQCWDDGQHDEWVATFTGDGVFRREPGSSQWVTSGRYRDTPRRTPDGWRFARRVFAPDASLRGLPQWW